MIEELRESSPSGGWHLCQQVMHRSRPRNRQETAVLRRLSERGTQSLESLRETVNTGEESLYTTLSRLEDRGYVYARDSRCIEITDAGREMIGLFGGATHR